MVHVEVVQQVMDNLDKQLTIIDMPRLVTYLNHTPIIGYIIQMNILFLSSRKKILYHSPSEDFLSYQVIAQVLPIYVDYLSL